MMLIAALLAAAVPLAAQPAEEASIVAPHDAEDVAAIDRVMRDVYAVISGPAGQERDWDAMRAMFTDDARLYAITPQGLRGGTVDDYITSSGPFLIENGFTEREIGHRLELYGNLAQVWSSYEGTFTMDGELRRVRGINSFQLMQDGSGTWKVHSILWQQETPTMPLPIDMDNQGGD
ncbi:hypothetical protein WJT74_07370 [Sphingomicrobium sp. XHP0239]|uniref:hypothetical protein n=1 Tax=Sphingomicrobium maritimum TaxID=3133972 RepID=UPI0031CCC730